jgi:hypothetical protein
MRPPLKFISSDGDTMTAESRDGFLILTIVTTSEDRADIVLDAEDMMRLGVEICAVLGAEQTLHELSYAGTLSDRAKRQRWTNWETTPPDPDETASVWTRRRKDLFASEWSAESLAYWLPDEHAWSKIVDAGLQWRPASRAEADPPVAEIHDDEDARGEADASPRYAAERAEALEAAREQERREDYAALLAQAFELLVGLADVLNLKAFPTPGAAGPVDVIRVRSLVNHLQSVAKNEADCKALHFAPDVDSQTDG